MKEQETGSDPDAFRGAVLVGVIVPIACAVAWPSCRGLVLSLDGSGG